MYKDGRLTITDWQKGQALSPFLGFQTMRNCEIFDNPGIVKISKQMEKDPYYTFAPQGMPIKRLKASNGDDFLLVTDILSGLTSTSLYKNGVFLTTITASSGNTDTAYDMVEYKEYIIVSTNANLFAYGINTLRITQNWKVLSGLYAGYYMKMLVGQDDILYIANGNNLATISNFVAGTASTDPTATLSTSALDLPAGQFATTIVELGRNILIGTQGGTSWSQIGNQRVANIYPWDRVSASFSLPVQIQENGIHAMIQVNNKVYVVAGTAGNIYVTDGTSYQKIGRIPWSQDRNISNSIRVFPNAIATNVNNNLIIGVSSGVGTQDQLGIYEIALSEGYPICLKNTPEGYILGSDLQIGFITTSNQGQTYVGYGVSGTYDLDYTLFNAYVGFGAVIESPLYSVGTSTNKKTFQHGEFILSKPLTYQHQVRVSYRKDTESDYVAIGTYSFSDLGSKRSHLFTPHIADAENVQIKIELDQNEYTSPNPTNWDLELMSISLW